MFIKKVQTGILRMEEGREDGEEWIGSAEVDVDSILRNGQNTASADMAWLLLFCIILFIVRQIIQSH